MNNKGIITKFNSLVCHRIREFFYIKIFSKGCESVGIKINETKLNEKLEDVMLEAVKKYEPAGEKANKELREKYTKGWFSDNGFSDSYHTMLNSLSYKNSMKKTSRYVYLNFESYVDPEKYDIEHTSLYKQRSKYGGIDATAYIVESLQWNRGIIGLPRHSDFGYSNWINTNFHQVQPLQEYMADKYKSEWERTVKKYL